MAKTNTSLVLRVCRADFTSHGGFQWPNEVGATVQADDYRNDNECGRGLHGWLHGQGDISCVDYWDADDAKWLVLEVASDEITMLGGKCKFPRAVVRFIGAKSEAAAYILQHEPLAREVAVIGACLKAGDKETVLVGGLGTATAGYRGTATAGESGTATAGNYGTATAGEKGEIRVQWWDEKAERYRTVIGYVGEDGIKPDTPYRLDSKHRFVEVSK